MNIVEYGSPQGKPVIYFHGAPGSPKEGLIFDEQAKQHDLKIICLDRFAIDSCITSDDYFKALAEAVTEATNDALVDIVGFSIGCQAAIHVCLHLKNKVNSLYLISPAAPLDSAHFTGMAGEFVFNLAIKHKRIFIMLSYWQKLMAKFTPNVLFTMLFARASGKDQSLSSQPVFKRLITQVLVDCFVGRLTGYIREINQYVAPWQNKVLLCTTRTYLWHGSADNWSPIGMAESLKQDMQHCERLEIITDLSHYSCLYAAVPRICAQLAKA